MMVKLHIGPLVELSEVDQYMFTQLFGSDTLGASAFATGSYDELCDLDRLIEHSYCELKIRYNKEDFTFEEAPMFYAVIIRG